jgi:hypothetical protein
MSLVDLDVWVIMDKDRTVIAKGVPRDRWLINVNKKKDAKRIITYSNEKRAGMGFTRGGFWTEGKKPWSDYELEAVKVKLTIQEDS